MENHFIQMDIMKKLLFSQNTKFTELKPNENIENNQLTFHLNQLIKDKLVEKNSDKTYSLTLKGKEYANRMDTDKKKAQKQGKIGAITCCIRENKDGEFEFLMYTRKKHPFYNHQGFASGKVPYGESVVESAIRELKEETNLECETGQVFMIEHHRVYNSSSEELLEDKYFYFVRFENPNGELKANEEGEFEWITESNLEEFLKKPFESIDRILYIAKRLKDFKKELTFEEIIHKTDSF